MAASRHRIFTLVLPAALLGWVSACGPETPVEPTCFAPDRNLETAYEPGAVGCACRPQVDRPVCVRDNTGRGVALICTDGKWLAVEDGPCEPQTTPVR